MKIQQYHKVLLIMCLQCFVLNINAQQEIPPKKEWTITSSKIQEDRFLAKYAIDDNLETRWSSAWNDDHWLEIDTGSAFECSGMRIYWQTAHAKVFTLYTSLDKKTWDKVYHTSNCEGGVQDIFIRSQQTRFLKIEMHTRATGWGYSILDIDLKGTNEMPVAKENGKDVKNTISLLDGDENTAWTSKKKKETELVLDLKNQTEIGGIYLNWGDNYGQTIDYLTSIDGKEWQEAVSITESLGQFEILKHDRRFVRFIKLIIKEPNKCKFTIKDITLYGPNKQVSKLNKYEILAQKMPLGLYPPQLRNMQVYWTLLGIPNDTEESLFDEYGNVEPVISAPMLAPLLKVDGKLLSAFDAIDIKQELVDGYLPIPTVIWVFKDFDLIIEGLAYGQPNRAVSQVSYKIRNKSSKSIDADLFFVIHPLEINPKWQHGGISNISKLNVVNNSTTAEINVNNKTLYVFNKPADKLGVTTFNDGPIVQQLYKNKFPESQTLESNEGLLSGALKYSIFIKENQSSSVSVAIPLHNNKEDINFSNPFQKNKDTQVKNWKEKLDKVGFSLGNKEVEQTLKAQVGYILLNQDGIVIQPGSRNYNRTWIRDGAMTCSALLRMGLFDESKAYLEWYAKRVKDNGHVPPILMNTGEHFGGFGSDIEWDAQGQFIYGMMEYYRFTKDRDFLNRYFPTIKKAMVYMTELREQTLKDGYMKEKEGNERFRGIIPGSISHEGYDIPTHSYWDDFWALRGWVDGVYAAKELNKSDIVVWGEKERQKLANSLKESMNLTSKYFDIDYIPGSADLGDFDPTSIAIGLFPCEALSIVPEDLIKKTFQSYVDTVKERISNGKTYAYTPYENRNILALAKLGMRKEAQQIHDIIFKDRRPSGWKHWVELVHSRERLGSYIGDMPHTWVGSGYMNSVRGLVIMENDVERRLELLNGAPLNWLENDGIALTNLPTHFGNANIKMVFNNRQLTVNINAKFNDLKDIRLYWPLDVKPKSVFVDGVKVDVFQEDSIILPIKTRNVVASW
ncbi:discoidin domain-containing protein [Snuella lapsa]|uniref:Discoidin domain-containing protein n=1 Tax=Snuella lapsa TaxID=870481 RepID=A0ABP6X5I4_9FLAO